MKHQHLRIRYSSHAGVVRVVVVYIIEEFRCYHDGSYLKQSRRGFHMASGYIGIDDLVVGSRARPPWQEEGGGDCTSKRWTFSDEMMKSGLY